LSLDWLYDASNLKKCKFKMYLLLVTLTYININSIVKNRGISGGRKWPDGVSQKKERNECMRNQIQRFSHALRRKLAARKAKIMLFGTAFVVLLLAIVGSAGSYLCLRAFAIMTSPIARAKIARDAVAERTNSVAHDALSSLEQAKKTTTEGVRSAAETVKEKTSAINRTIGSKAVRKKHELKKIWTKWRSKSSPDDNKDNPDP
jgi:hypothetical protein